MLNEKVTVTICGKTYNLRTNDTEAIKHHAAEADRRISEYCKLMPNNPDVKEDACVLSVLDMMDELGSTAAQRDDLLKKVTALTSTAEKAAAALDENKRLSAENVALMKESEEFEALKKCFSELEGKNAQLARTLSEANSRAADNADAKAALDKAEVRIKSLEDKNAQLADTLKSAGEKGAELQKNIDGLTKQNADLRKQTETLAQLTEEKKQLTAKLEKAADTEEALRRCEERANTLEKDREKLKASAAELDVVKKELNSQKGRTSDLEKKLAAAEKSAAELAEAKQSLAAEKGRNSDLEKKLSAAEKSAAELAEAKQSLAAEKGRNSDLEKKLSAAEKSAVELAEARKSLADEKSRSADLEQQLADSRRETDEALTDNSEMEKEISELRQKSDKYEELMVRFSQIESENTALRAAGAENAGNPGQTQEIENLKKQLSAALSEVKELKKTNTSLNKQLNEMLEDGQLTL